MFMQTAYKHLIRPIVFALSKDDPEKAHEKALELLHYLGESKLVAKTLRSFLFVDDLRLRQNFFGLEFPNLVGLAAGFDKDGVAIFGLEALGFGFEEIGAVVLVSQAGNPRPRIFRFPADETLINRMGFNSNGVDMVVSRLSSSRRLRIPLFINLGKVKATPLEKSDGEYALLLRKLYRYADGFVINVSSPNTPNLRRLHEANYLRSILCAINAVREEFPDSERKPVFVKISPDLTWGAIDDVLTICLEYGINGIVATNTTISRTGFSIVTNEAGGMSGPPLRKRVLEVIKYIHRQTHGSMFTIGVGGISCAQDAYEMTKSGASLIQILTSLVFRGPSIVYDINKGLLKLMERDGIKHISQLRGGL